MVRGDSCEAWIQAKTEESIFQDALPDWNGEEDGVVLDSGSEANEGAFLPELAPKSGLRRSFPPVACHVVQTRNASLQGIQDPSKKRAVRESEDGGIGSSQPAREVG